MSRCSYRGPDGRGLRCRVEGHLVGDDGLCATHRDPERWKAAQQKGGEATARAWAREGLKPEDLPVLVDHDSVKEFLEVVARGVLTGQIGHNDANAATRAAAEWTKTHDSALTAKVVDELQARIDELEAELARRSKMRAVK